MHSTLLIPNTVLGTVFIPTAHNFITCLERGKNSIIWRCRCFIMRKHFHLLSTVEWNGNGNFYACTMIPEHYKLVKAKQTKCDVTCHSVMTIPRSVTSGPSRPHSLLLHITVWKEKHWPMYMNMLLILVFVHWLVEYSAATNNYCHYELICRSIFSIICFASKFHYVIISDRPRHCIQMSFVQENPTTNNKEKHDILIFIHL